MSSILIKDMEMSKDKPICIIIDPAGQARHYDLNNDKYADDELFEAVPVPPHGRLIDADELIRSNGLKEIPEYYEVVLAAPTIILAEEGET